MIVTLDDEHDQSRGVIREKAKFPMIRGPNGEVQRAAFSRYFIRVYSIEDRECLMEDTFVRRDRKVFTKQNLKSFLRHSLQRESYTGAPWLVKEPLAIQYRLPMEIPARLLQDAKLLAHKVQLTQDFFIPRSFLCNPADISQQQMLSTKGPRGRKKQMSGDDFKKIQENEVARMHMMGQVRTPFSHRLFAFANLRFSATPWRTPSRPSYAPWPSDSRAEASASAPSDKVPDRGSGSAAKA